MMSIRKIQLLAALVIVNGVLALTLSPEAAQAASCNSVTACAPAIACSLPQYACQPPAGCQLVSVTCGAICSTWPVSQAYVTCNFAPL
jgi:hypothetical protein